MIAHCSHTLGRKGKGEGAIEWQWTRAVYPILRSVHGGRLPGWLEILWRATISDGTGALTPFVIVERGVSLFAVPRHGTYWNGGPISSTIPSPVFCFSDEWMGPWNACFLWNWCTAKTKRCQVVQLNFLGEEIEFGLAINRAQKATAQGNSRQNLALPSI